MNARMLNSDVNILVMSYCNCIDASKKSSPCVATNMPYGISVNACMLCHAATCSGVGKERCSTAIASPGSGGRYCAKVIAMWRARPISSRSA